MFRSPHSPPPAGPSPHGDSGVTSATIIPLAKAVSRLRGIRAVIALRRTGYLIDIGDRYILVAHAPESGSYLRVEPNGLVQPVR